MTEKRQEISRLGAAKRYAYALAAKRATLCNGGTESQAGTGTTTNALTVIPRQRPDTLEAVKALVLNSLNSPHSKLAYGFALDAFLPWLRNIWRGPFNRAAVQPCCCAFVQGASLGYGNGTRNGLRQACCC